MQCGLLYLFILLRCLYVRVCLGVVVEAGIQSESAIAVLQPYHEESSHVVK